MAEDTVYVGSRLRIELPAYDITPTGEVPFALADPEIKVYGPKGNQKEVGTVGSQGGTYYIDFGAGQLDSAGIWSIKATADGYRAKATWRVERW